MITDGWLENSVVYMYAAISYQSFVILFYLITKL